MEFVYKKATAADMDILLKTRIIVLKAANRLPYDADLSETEKNTRDYYKKP